MQVRRAHAVQREASHAFEPFETLERREAAGFEERLLSRHDLSEALLHIERQVQHVERRQAPEHERATHRVQRCERAKIGARERPDVEVAGDLFAALELIELRLVLDHHRPFDERRLLAAGRARQVLRHLSQIDRLGRACAAENGQSRCAASAP